MGENEARKKLQELLARDDGTYETQKYIRQELFGMPRQFIGVSDTLRQQYYSAFNTYNNLINQYGKTQEQARTLKEQTEKEEAIKNIKEGRYDWRTGTELAQKFDILPPGMAYFEGQGIVSEKTGQIVEGPGQGANAPPAKPITYRQEGLAKVPVTTPEIAPVPAVAPTVEFKKTPEMEQIENIIKSRLVKEPALTPEMVTKWEETVQSIYGPAERQAIKGLREEYSFISPESFGSSEQMNATRNLLKEQAANKTAVALQLGTTEYNQKMTDYNNALTQLTQLQQYYDTAKNLKTEQERQDFWNIKQREWQVEDVSKQRTMQLEDVERQEEQYWKQLMAAQYWQLSTEQRTQKYNLEAELRSQNTNLENWLKQRAATLSDEAREKMYYEDIMNKYYQEPPEQNVFEKLLYPAIQTGLNVGAGNLFSNLIPNPYAQPTTTPIAQLPGVAGYSKTSTLPTAAQPTAEEMNWLKNLMEKYKNLTYPTAAGGY